MSIGIGRPGDERVADDTLSFPSTNLLPACVLKQSPVAQVSQHFRAQDIGLGQCSSSLVADTSKADRFVPCATICRKLSESRPKPSMTRKTSNIRQIVLLTRNFSEAEIMSINKLPYECWVFREIHESFR